MADLISSVNTGSSSIKFAAYLVGGFGRRLTLHCRGEIDGIGNEAHLTVRDARGRELVRRALMGPTPHASALASMLDWFATELTDHTIVAAGHRVVHGGDEFVGPVVVDPDVIGKLQQLSPLAASHQPFNLAGIAALAHAWPALVQVACLDTAYHQTQPSIARTFAIPRELTASGVRRYGFHGLSYEYISSVLDQFAGENADGNVVVAHLGHGTRMCAIDHGRSVATTMGFTVLDGLMMGRRCGELDPGPCRTCCVNVG